MCKSPETVLKQYSYEILSAIRSYHLLFHSDAELYDTPLERVISYRLATDTAIDYPQY